MNELEAIVLGLIQGLTEFLPVSSSGHLEIGKAIMETKVFQKRACYLRLFFTLQLP